MRLRTLALVGGILLAYLSAPPAHAQEATRCLILCTPSVTLAPSVTVSNLFHRPRVLELETNSVTELPREAEFELLLAVDVPTTIPRIGLTFEVIFAPFAGASANPFTGYDAEELEGEEEIRANPLEFELEFKLFLLRFSETGGWVQTHFDVVDQFSPAEAPEARGFYTHKLNFELDAAVAAFKWLPEGNWFRHLELEGSLDYLATGLPKAGDEAPKGEQRFLTDASPWSFTASVTIPIAPLKP